MAKKLVQARVLVGFSLGGQEFSPNDLVQGEPGVIKAYEKNNQIDSDKAAVEYAIGLGAVAKNIEGDGQEGELPTGDASAGQAENDAGQPTEANPVTE